MSFAYKNRKERIVGLAALANKRLGTFATSSVGGETARAFVPPVLPPDPPVNLDALIGLLVRATAALGRLDGVTTVLPHPPLFIYMYVRKPGDKAFEVAFTNALKFLFDNQVTGSKQHRTEEGMSIFDLVARITASHDFWTMLVDSFKSHYVIFEFKNYVDKIGQGQIYTARVAQPDQCSNFFNSAATDAAIIEYPSASG